MRKILTDAAAIGKRRRAHAELASQGITRLVLLPGFNVDQLCCGRVVTIGFMDANKDYFDGAKTYKVTLPPDIPVKNFW
jgi:hypothetical protein